MMQAILARASVLPGNTSVLMKEKEPSVRSDSWRASNTSHSSRCAHPLAETNFQSWCARPHPASQRAV